MFVGVWHQTNRQRLPVFACLAQRQVNNFPLEFSAFRFDHIPHLSVETLERSNSHSGIHQHVMNFLRANHNGIGLRSRILRPQQKENQSNLEVHASEARLSQLPSDHS